MQSMIQFLDYLDSVYNDHELDTLEYGWNYFVLAYGSHYKETYLKRELKLMSPYKITYKIKNNTKFMVIDFERNK